MVIFASPDIQKQAPLNVQKLDVFQLQWGFALLTSRPGPLSFAYCFINTVSLLDTIYDICAIGLLFR